MYVDFGHGDRESSTEIQCPGAGDFGCDGVGCYAYVPWSEETMALFPRVKDVEVHTTTIGGGDVLLLPAFWFHYVYHLPLMTEQEQSGALPKENIAVTFVRRLFVNGILNTRPRPKVRGCRSGAKG